MSCTTVPAGHVGVVSTFGKVDDAVLDEGLHFIAPWRSCYRMSAQTKEDKEEADVPTKKGLSVRLDVSFIYGLDVRARRITSLTG
jgi:regulator of protease activity HflC (stomatin/prohibitin superfamily)